MTQVCLGLKKVYSLILSNELNISHCLQSIYHIGNLSEVQYPDQENKNNVPFGKNANILNDLMTCTTILTI